MTVIDNVSVRLSSVLRSDLQGAGKLRVASALFSVFAFDTLREELASLNEVQVLLTTPVFAEKQKDAGVQQVARKALADVTLASIGGSELELHLKNSLMLQKVARECASWVADRGVRFKSLRGGSQVQPMVVVDSQSAFSPIAGFTAAGLGEVNKPEAFVSGRFEASEATQFMRLFDAVWSDPKRAVDVTEQVVEVLEKLFAVNSPAFVYFVVLYNIFSEFLESLAEDFLPNDLTGFKETQIWQNLFNFQKDAATGIINRLERFNGCILADSVGLGKTYTALAVMKYFELRNKRVLVLAPKKLMGNWTLFNQNSTVNPLANDRFAFDVLAHTDLGRESGSSGGIDLGTLNWGNYDLLVIDESHNFRNVGTNAEKESRYQKLMRKVITAGVKTKVLMLSATPVNNRFHDLKNQLDLAYEGDSELLTQQLGIESGLDYVFRQAQKAFNKWSDFDAEDRTPQAILKMLDFDFFEVLDAVTIARSRKQIQRNYDTSAIGVFPTRRAPLSLKEGLTYLEDAPTFTDVNDELMKLSLAVYTPLRFVQPSALSHYELTEDQLRNLGTAANVNAKGREAGLRKLMAVNLLKRLESSVEAFRLTLNQLYDRIESTLDKVNSFLESPTVADQPLLSADMENEDLATDDELAASTVGGKFEIRLADMDVLTWKRELEADSEIISQLLQRIDPITVDHDAKFQQLFNHIKSKAANPINPGNRKVLIFSAFADTAEYLFEKMAPRLLREGLQSALVTGSTGTRSTLQKPLDFEKALTLFSPVSKNRAGRLPEETAEIDILFATDCISEGQNLQDCDYLVNYDIHWNPVRIIQRFGRIDRIGSQNAEIQLVNFWPDVELDEYLNIKDRVEGRMVIANVAGTGDDNVLISPTSTSVSNTDSDYRKRQLERLQSEVLDLEDTDSGISITDLGLNDYRLDLQAFLDRFGDFSTLPSGIHAAVLADEERGLVPGAFFVVKDTAGSGDRGNRLHPFVLVYVDESGQPVTEFTDAKATLQLLRAACVNELEPVDPAVQLFNDRTAVGADMSFYQGLLESALRSVDSAANESLVESLFSGTLTSVSGELAGSDRFELLALVAVVAG